MNKTQNYKLNQWEKSDRVLMEDFNADNAKIDAAIHEADSRLTAAVAAERSARVSAVQAARDACPLVVLRSVTLTGNTSNYALDLTGFDWEDYAEVMICMLLKSADHGATVKVLLNGQSGIAYYASRSSGNQEYLNSMVLYPYGISATCRLLRSAKGFHSEWLSNFLWALPQYLYSRDENIERSSFTKMNFTGCVLAAGTRFTILGIRG